MSAKKGGISMTAREWLHNLYVPVLVGEPRAVRQTARRLFFYYGLVSHLFAHHIPFLSRLAPFMSCHNLPRSTNDILSFALSDFADEIILSDRQPLLILCQDAPEVPNFAAMECKYLICREEQLPELFANLIQFTQGEQSL